jgi:GAF domain-containing protein
VSGRALLEGKAAQVEDVHADPEYTFVDLSKAEGFRICLCVPMLRNGAPIGLLVLVRSQVRPFNEKQIELVQTFADQAVIAIEKARLFNEVQAKTRDLEASLQQQTATADVLKLISRSAFDLQAVLQTLVESAAKLCIANMAVITREVNGVLYRAESYGCSAEFMAEIRYLPILPDRGTLSGRVLLEGKAVQIEDVETDPEYAFKTLSQIDEFHTWLGIPMCGVERQSELSRYSERRSARSTISRSSSSRPSPTRPSSRSRTRGCSTRCRPRRATSRKRWRSRPQQRTSSAFDLQAVLTTLAESACELCGASFVTLNLRDGEVMRLRAESGRTPEIVAFLHAHPIRAGRETYTGRVMLSGEPVHLPDVLADPEYRFGEGPSIGNCRALLCRTPFARGTGRRRPRARPAGAGRVHRAPDRNSARLRRPGRDRHPERAIVQRGAGPDR